MTDTQEKIAKIRATEGELQRTIAGLTPVESARVHLAVARSDPLLDDAGTDHRVGRDPHKPGETLSPQEVRGITQLVSGAVEGLKPENVTIVNQDGTVLVPSPSTAGPDGRQPPTPEDDRISSSPSSGTRRISSRTSKGCSTRRSARSVRQCASPPT